MKGCIVGFHMEKVSLMVHKVKNGNLMYLSVQEVGVKTCFGVITFLSNIYFTVFVENCANVKLFLSGS